MIDEPPWPFLMTPRQHFSKPGSCASAADPAAARLRPRYVRYSAAFGRSAEVARTLHDRRDFAQLARRRPPPSPPTRAKLRASSFITACKFCSKNSAAGTSSATNRAGFSSNVGGVKSRRSSSPSSIPCIRSRNAVYDRRARVDPQLRIDWKSHA